MPSYTGLDFRLRAIDPRTAEHRRWDGVAAYLIETWLNDYAAGTPVRDVVEVGASGFSYLFDIGAERLIAAWGVSQGAHSGPRDKARMAGHPLSAGPHFHRGHAIAHSLGGGTDINLVPQFGRVNIGAFRELERRAVAAPGSLYFSYWLYPPASAVEATPTQTPSGVEQGLLIPGQAPMIRTHGN